MDNEEYKFSPVGFGLAVLLSLTIVFMFGVIAQAYWWLFLQGWNL